MEGGSETVKLNFRKLKYLNKCRYKGYENVKFAIKWYLT